MARKLSRRILAQYVVEQMTSGTPKNVVVKQLAAYLVDTRRTKELPMIVKDIEQELLTRGTVAATVTSAFELSSSAKKAIESMIKRATDATTVELATAVDTAVLGGIKLELPGKELDNTIARKLTSLRTNYKKV